MAPNESSDSAVSDLKDQVVALQRQAFSLLLALIVVSGTVTVYMYRQASMEGKDLEALKQQGGAIINTFNQNRAGFQNFISQLNAYGQTHPEIEQLLIRNGFAAAPKK
jgi:hypothetical protein